MDFGTRQTFPSAAEATGVIKDATSASFSADVIEASRTVPVIVDFWAPWCQPCKQLTPVLEKLVKAQNGKVKLVKVNADENQTIAAQLRVQSLPTVYAFRDGQPVDGFVGGQPESAVKAFIERLVSQNAQASLEDVLKTGEELLDLGDISSAAEVFASILQEDRTNGAALAGLAQCYLESGEVDRAKQMVALIPPGQRGLARAQSVHSAIELSEKGAAAGDLEKFASRLRNNPKDNEARFELAVGLAARGEKEQGMLLLLDLIESDRSWNEDAARKQLLQLFDAWGNKDPLVAEGRRRLSSLLFR